MATSVRCCPASSAAFLASPSCSSSSSLRSPCLASPLPKSTFSTLHAVFRRHGTPLHVANAKNVSSERKGVTVSPPEPEMSPQERAAYDQIKSQLEGTSPDFWEGPQWNGLGFVIQYLWVFGIAVSIVACIVAVRTYNLGATDFKSTAVFKEALEQQAGDLGDSSEPSVFDDSNKEAP